jgi:hypothetical protein
MSRGLYRPRPATVQLGPGGTPVMIGRSEVEAIREEWLVEDHWWTSRLLRRRYFELTTVEGADRVVFCDLETGRWFAQKGA